MEPKRIINTYLSLTAVTTLSQSLIWGVNTLFLLAAGLNIFQVMIVNASYTAGLMIFQIPTGVIADTLGRKVCYLLSTATTCLATILYAIVGYYHLGLWPFIWASILIGLGFTFYTGAVDAWMVDALKSKNYEGKLENIFAKSGIIFGASMLVGTTLGGVLGTKALWIPYALRAMLLIPAFIIGFIFMKDIGFEKRPLELKRFGEETRKIAKDGLSYVIKDKVVLFLMMCTFTQGLFFIYGFYSWQKYFLDLLGQNLAWITGIIAALIGLSQIIGNSLVSRISRKIKSKGTIIIVLVIIQSLAIIGASLTHSFYLAVSLYLASTLSFGIMMPIKSSWLNERIPSKQRATLLSLDSLSSDTGGTIGQLGLGYLSKTISIPFAWLLGGIIQIFGAPLIWLAKNAENKKGGMP